MIQIKDPPVIFKEGEVIFRQGDPEGYAYIILSGYVEIRVESANGSAKIATLGPQNLLGEISIIDGGPRSATAVAVNEVTCQKIKKYQMERIFGDDKSVARSLFEIQTQRIRTANTAKANALT